MILQKTLIFFAAIAIPALSVAEEINWRTDLASAVDEATREGKPIMLHCSASWCGPCQSLEKYVFPKSDVANAVNSSTIPVAIDIDASPEIARRYNIKQIPHDVYLTPGGYVLLSRSSPRTAGEYVAVAGSVAKLYRTQDAIASGSLNTMEAVAKVAEFAGDPQDGEVKQQSHVVDSNVKDFMGRKKTLVDHATGSLTNVGEMVENAAKDKYNTDDRFLPQSPKRDFMSGKSIKTSSAQPASRPGGEFSAATANQFVTATPDKAELRAFGNVVANPFIRSNGSSAGSQTASKPRPEPAPENKKPESKSNSISPQQSFSQANVPAKDDGPGLDGYCPVTLQKEQKWSKGDKQFGCYHRGKLFLFTSVENRDLFMGDPDQYAPALVGFDPVIYAETGKLVGGKREIGVFYPANEPKIYVFATEESKARFQQTPELFSDKVRVATQECDASSFR